MTDLNPLEQQAKDEENNIEQITEESDEFTDDWNSENTSSPIVLIVYAIVIMTIFILLLN